MTATAVKATVKAAAVEATAEYLRSTLHALRWQDFGRHDHRSMCSRVIKWVTIVLRWYHYRPFPPLLCFRPSSASHSFLGVRSVKARRRVSSSGARSMALVTGWRRSMVFPSWFWDGILSSTSGKRRERHRTQNRTQNQNRDCDERHQRTALFSWGAVRAATLIFSSRTTARSMQ